MFLFTLYIGLILSKTTKQNLASLASWVSLTTRVLADALTWSNSRETRWISISLSKWNSFSFYVLFFSFEFLAFCVLHYSFLTFHFHDLRIKYGRKTLRIKYGRKGLNQNLKLNRQKPKSSKILITLKLNMFKLLIWNLKFLKILQKWRLLI